MMDRLYVYEIEYRDARDGDLRETEVVAKDSGEALDIAMREDYYFGEFLCMTDDSDAREATPQEVDEYNRG